MLRAALWLFAVNFVVQLALKPTEIFRFSRLGDERSVRQTWLDFGPHFREHATAVITPDFLAGLAQTESSGDPYAHPRWVWRLTPVPWRVYAPASSAVGLMQMTDGNFAQARRFCVKDGRALAEGCRLNGFYSRLSPADSIEMTSAFLHHHVQRLAPRKSPLRRRQELAGVIHLCGPERGLAFIRAGFDAKALDSCGRQRVAPYVRRVMRYREEFEALSKQGFGSARVGS